MSFRGKCTTNNAHNQNVNAWGDVFAHKKGKQVGFFLCLTNDFPYFVWKNVSI